MSYFSFDDEEGTRIDIRGEHVWLWHRGAEVTVPLAVLRKVLDRVDPHRPAEGSAAVALLTRIADDVRTIANEIRRERQMPLR